MPYLRFNAVVPLKKMLRCDEEYEDKRKDGLVDSNSEHSISNTARSIEDVEKSMDNEFNKIWIALSNITLDLSNRDTKCECKKLSYQLLKEKESVLLWKQRQKLKKTKLHVSRKLSPS